RLVPAASEAGRGRRDPLPWLDADTGFLLAATCGGRRLRREAEDQSGAISPLPLSSGVVFAMPGADARDRVSTTRCRLRLGSGRSGLASLFRQGLRQVSDHAARVRRSNTG